MANSGKSIGQGARDRARDALEESLRQLERQLPKNLSRLVHQLRANLRTLQTQLERLRADREERWNRLQTQVRRDAARIFRRLEKAVEPKQARRTARGGKRAAARPRPAKRKIETAKPKHEAPPLRTAAPRAVPLAAARREPEEPRPIGEPPA